MGCAGVDALTITSWCEKLETQAAVKRLYDLLDKNHDGKIVASEWMTFLRQALGNEKVTIESAEKSMAFKDANKDGALSLAEFKECCQGLDPASIKDMCKQLEDKSKAGGSSSGFLWPCCSGTTKSSKGELVVDQ